MCSFWLFLLFCVIFEWLKLIGVNTYAALVIRDGGDPVIVGFLHN